jgi:hypothetical protein
VYAVVLIVQLFLPSDPNKSITYNEPMASIAECNAAVREMTWRSPAELKEGGVFLAGCRIEVPKSENP